MKATQSTVAIIGCGWLGKHLIPALAPHYQLIATTAHLTSAKALPIPAYPFNWAEDPLPQNVSQANHIIIAIPPNTGTRSDYPQHMAGLAAKLQPRNHLRNPQSDYHSNHLIMISSTSVYPQQPSIYREDSAIDTSSIIYQAEQNLRSHLPQATILRCAGLIGEDRIPGKRWFGQQCDLANQRLNLIHHSDISQAISLILAQSQQKLTYNLAHPDHIWRHEYYQKQAERHGNAPPQFSNPHKNPDRIIDGTKITTELPFTYRHNTLEAYY